MTGKFMKMKKILGLVLAFALLLTCLPVEALATQVEETVLDGYAGKTVSILSHSASTYAGVSNDTTANSTIGNNDIYYTAGRHDVYLKDTWWQQTIDALGMELLVNNSWSGSCVLMPRKGAASVGYADRALNLHNDHTGEEPDVIFIYLGCNDFAYYKDTFGKAADVDYAELIADNGDGTFTYRTPQTTCEAYAIMLHKVQNRYPDAEIFCMTSTARRETDYTGDNYPDAGQPTEYSAELQKVAVRFNFPVIDLEKAIPKDTEIFDKYMGDKRAHPNALGMDQITNQVLSVVLGTDAEIRHVTSEDGTVGEQAVLLGGSYHVEVELPEYHSIVVTMDGKDVTDHVWNNGEIFIETVTGDITVHTVIKREPLQFGWEMQNDQLISIGATYNEANKLAGIVTNGVLNSPRYQLATPVVLKHDLPWEVEWQFTGNWRGCVFSSDPAQNTKGMTYLSRTVGGQISFGTWTGQQYDNFGVDLSYLDDQTHIYRFVNKIAADGSNMVWAYVDGEEIGPMNHYFIGSRDQAQTSDWISGKDFLFSYIGMEGHALKDGRLQYLKVCECVHSYENGICASCGTADTDAKIMNLQYDDHYDVTGKTVKIIDAGKPTSYQVGYGVAENAVLDTAVVTLEGNNLVATGIGNAQVSIDGEIYEITVTAAPISLLLLIGQSNMRGSEGNADQSIVCPDGMVYATFGDDRGDAEGIMNVNNATNFAASALTGEYSTVNVNGSTDNLSYYPINSLTDAGKGTFGPDSGFAYEWVKQTGEKVWVVNAAHGGSSITSWQPNATNFKEAVLLFSACQETLRKEIAAGHFTLSHMGYFWCQGCSDYNWTAEKYVTYYLAMHNGLKSSLTFDHDSNSATDARIFEFAGIIPVRAGHDYNDGYREGAYTDTTSYRFYESFKDIQMTGPRVAQYWMCNNPELEDIWLVCNAGEDWVWMPDGTNGVSDYFQRHYENGTVDYTTQVQQKASWYTPTTPKDVHDSIHYNQIGYNEVGRESVRNTLIMLGIREDYEEETTVKLVNWTGYLEAEEVAASTTGNTNTLVVPIVSPVTRSKDVSYQLSEGLFWNYYDLLAMSKETTGALTVSGAQNKVSVVKAALGSHYASHLIQLPETFCADVNLWSVLEHDQYYFANGNQWSIYSGGRVWSVTIPVEPGDKIYATSFEKAGTNGHESSNGIRVTFFSDYGVAKTMNPAETYAEFTANGGYLVAPEGAVAVNIPMWNNSNENELFILSAEHDYKAAITAPSCTEGGYTTYTCVCGDSYVGDEVDATGHKYETVVTTPTCTEGGYTTYTCVCGHSYVDNRVNATGHKYETVVTAPTCTEGGYTTYTCACGHSYVDNRVNATGHKYETVLTAPTCTKDGYTTYTCFCGYSYVGDEVDATGHKYETVLTAPTCTEGGFTTYTCTVCDHSYVDNRLNATGHKYETVVTAPTCTEGGYTTYTCTCGHSYVGDEVAATGHKYETVVTVPTCTEQGYTTYTCACGHSYVGGEVDATGHKYEAVVTTPTCTEGGYTTYTCVCGHSYVGDEVDATGHKYETVVTTPTCTEGGYTTHQCLVCHYSYVDAPTAPAEHTPKESVKENETKTGYDLVVYCADCEKELSREHVQTHLPGDINGDGQVNNRDATRLFQFLAGWNVEVDKNALDVNGDGRINNRDATLLFQYLAGWDVEIH